MIRQREDETDTFSPLIKNRERILLKFEDFEDEFDKQDDFT